MRVILLILFFAFSAQAQTAETQYVDVSCPNSGDGSVVSPCASGAGLAGPYNTIRDWEAQDRNLVTEDVVLTVELTGGTDDNGSFNSIVSLDGWTTDATRTITLNGDSTYTVANNMSSGCILDLKVSYTTANDINTDNNRTVSGVSGASGICISNVGNITIDGGSHTYSGTGGGGGCNGTSDTCAAIRFAGGASYSGINIVRNTLSYGAGGYNVGIKLDNKGSTNTADFVIDNNTVNDMQLYGIHHEHTNTSTPDLYVRNNVVVSSGTADYQDDSTNLGTLSTATNYTSDTSTPDGAAYDNFTAPFTDEPNDDFTLSTDLAGTDLSGDSINPFSTDFNDTARDSGAWSAGAFEVTGGGGGSSPIIQILMTTGDI